MSSHEPLADHVFGQQNDPGPTVPAHETVPVDQRGHAEHREQAEHSEQYRRTEDGPAQRARDTEQGGDTEPLGGTEHADTQVRTEQYANPGAPQGPPAVRTGTMVWGLLALILGLGAMAVAAGRQVDLEIALISVFVLAGAGLLIGSTIGAAQRSLAQRKHRSQLG